LFIAYDSPLYLAICNIHISENEIEEITCPPPFEAYGAIKRCKAMWGPHEGWLPCDQALPVSTRVFLECPAFYERRRGSASAICLHDGTWSQPFLSCIPICGIRDSTGSAIDIPERLIKKYIFRFAKNHFLVVSLMLSIIPIFKMPYQVTILENLKLNICNCIYYYHCMYYCMYY